MIGTGCGMRSPGDLTFAADIKLDFITDSTDSMKDSSGFFAHVYSEGSRESVSGFSILRFLKNLQYLIEF